MAYFHFGVIRALIESKNMPTILSGASGGAMVSAWIAVRTDQEVLDLLQPDMYQYLNPCEESWWTCFHRFRQTGFLFDWHVWLDKTKLATQGDTTFEEAYRRTGRVLNIAMTSAHKVRGAS
jgi:predicted acylesterase/phospholipase RssA